MNSKFFRYMVILSALFMVAVAVSETDAIARVGGGRSFGSRGSRSLSTPSSPYSRPTQTQPSQPYSQPYQPQPAGGGFFRNMAGGILGGILGGMLFRGLGFGGGGLGGSGIGLFDIILIAGICYMIFRMVKKRREGALSNQGSYGQGDFQQSYTPPQEFGQQFGQEASDPLAGLAHIRQMDSIFDENRFTDNVMDIFFKVQSAWMNRDLAPAASLLTDEMRRLLQGDIERMLGEKRINHLENIAVRSVEVIEAWQEEGKDYITARIYANLLDYTTDDTSGAVVEGSRTDPVKFEEHWTFVRPVGNNPWQLSAINQI